MTMLLAANLAGYDGGYGPEDYGVDYVTSGTYEAFMGESGGRVTGSQACAQAPLSPYNDTGYFRGTFTAINEGFAQICCINDLTGADNNWWWTCWKGTNLIISIIYAADGYLHAYRGDGKTTGVLLGVSSLPMHMDDGLFHVYEFHLKIDGTDGIFQMRIDSTTVIDFAGNTQPGADTTFDNIRIHRMAGGGGGPWGVRYNDFIVNSAEGDYNNSWPNGAYCQVIVPTGDGGQTQWTPSVGSNWSCVDEYTPSATDYINSNTNGAVDVYTFENLNAQAVTIKAVIPMVGAWREGVPITTQISPVMRKGGTNYSIGAPYTPQAVAMALMHHDISEVDPTTNLPFTVDDINNNIEFGIKAET
jgi:hypothetical protein